MNIVNKTLCLLFFITTSNGCSTIQTHSSNIKIVKPYSGTKAAINKTKKVWVSYDYYGQVGLYAIDVPASLIADTIVLPFDLYKYFRRPSISE